MAHVRTPPSDRKRRSADLISLAKGGGFMMGGGMVEFVFRLGIAWMLARSLGASGYGQYSLVVGVAAIVVGIGGLGLDDAMVRYLAIQTTRDDGAGMRGTLQVGIAGALIVGAASAVGIFMIAEPIAVGLFEDPDLIPLLQFVAGIVPFLLLSNLLLGVTRGFNRMDYAAFAENVVQSVVRFVLIAVLWMIHLDPFMAVVAFGAADIVATFLLGHFVRRLVREVRFPKEAPRRDVGEIFGFALPLWISGLLNRFRRNIETFALGIFSIAADVGIFAIAAKVNFVAHMVYRSVVVAVKPLLARSFADDDHAALSNIYAAATRWTFTLTLPFLVVTVLYASEILGVFGEEFTAGTTAFIILAFSELSLSITGTCGSMIDMAGHTRVKVFNSVLWVVLATGFALLLIPAFGVVGAALGSMISVAVVNIVRTVEVWVLDRLQPYRSDFWKPIAAGVVSAGAGVGIRVGVGAPGLWWIPQGMLVAMVYALCLMAFGIHDDDRVILRRVGSRVGSMVRGSRSR